MQPAKQQQYRASCRIATLATFALTMWQRCPTVLGARSTQPRPPPGPPPRSRMSPPPPPAPFPPFTPPAPYPPPAPPVTPPAPTPYPPAPTPPALSPPSPPPPPEPPQPVMQPTKPPFPTPPPPSPNTPAAPPTLQLPAVLELRRLPSYPACSALGIAPPQTGDICLKSFRVAITSSSGNGLRALVMTGTFRLGAANTVADDYVHNAMDPGYEDYTETRRVNSGGYCDSGSTTDVDVNASGVFMTIYFGLSAQTSWKYNVLPGLQIQIPFSVFGVSVGGQPEPCGGVASVSVAQWGPAQYQLVPNGVNIGSVLPNVCFGALYHKPHTFGM